MLQTAYKDAPMGTTQVYEWFARFMSGQLSLEDQSRSGRPPTSRTDENITKICKLILEDCCRTIHELVLTGVSWSSCQRLLTEELGMKRIRVKLAPRLLTDHQK
ncbi:protein GVQW3-like [Oratosquilla oratoria]|uniref:protein GVQW3-like n=1 Tax=Oratosquilla oratoria TaxID=337810 RepID=UPI003F75E8AA